MELFTRSRSKLTSDTEDHRGGHQFSEARAQWNPHTRATRTTENIGAECRKLSKDRDRKGSIGAALNKAKGVQQTREQYMEHFFKKQWDKSAKDSRTKEARVTRAAQRDGKSWTTCRCRRGPQHTEIFFRKHTDPERRKLEGQQQMQIGLERADGRRKQKQRQTGGIRRTQPNTTREQRTPVATRT